MKYASLFLFFVFGFSEISAQEQWGNWQQYFGNVRFGEGAFRLHFDAQHRDHNWLGDLDQTIIRPGVQFFHKASQSSYTLGYAFFYFETEGVAKKPILENRIFQDIDLRQSINRVKIRHRYRFEERFVENKPFAFRARYCIFIDIPINNTEIEANTLYIPLMNELFLSPKPTVGSGVFDRNWLYGGIGYRFNSNFAMQAGVLNHYTIKTVKPQFVLALLHNISFAG